MALLLTPAFVSTSFAFTPEARATAEYDTGSNDAANTDKTDPAPPAVSTQNREPSGETLEDTASSPVSQPDTGSSNTDPPSNSSAAPGQQTYSIRLPLGVPGSVIPKIHTPAPAAPHSGTFLPASENLDYNRPAAWRATAEAIRNQPAGSSLVVSTLSADFKTTYNAIIQEARSTGWSLASLSLPAGHFLLRIPRSNDTGDSKEDAAAWLILVASPIDSGATELRVKIQRAAGFSTAVTEFLQRCQMRATGNKLL